MEKISKSKYLNDIKVLVEKIHENAFNSVPKSLVTMPVGLNKLFDSLDKGFSKETETGAKFIALITSPEMVEYQKDVDILLGELNKEFKSKLFAMIDEQFDRLKNLERV